MIVKLLPVGLMVCGVAFATQTASAQGGAWNGGCQSNAPTGPEPSNWHGPTSYQRGAAQPMAPPPAPQAPGTNRPVTQQAPQGAMNNQQVTMQPQPGVQGQTAQNNQQYQSFSAEPQAVPMNSYAPNTYSYPAYGGYYGNPYYGGTNYGYPSYNSGWSSQFDNARFHGTNPNAYP